MKKILLVSLLTILLIPSSVFAGEWTHSGTGQSGSGAGYPGGGNWNHQVYGVRVTFVNKDGSRTKINVNGKNIYSDSIDIYGNRYSDGVERITKNTEHSVCKKPDGKTTLCSKFDITKITTSKSKLKTTKGSNSYKWFNKNTFGLTFGSFIKGGGQVPSVSFKQIETKPERAKALFKAAFGVSYADAYKSSGTECSVNREALEKSYIIYEPITSLGSSGAGAMIASGSELAQYFANTGADLEWEVLPAMGNAVYVDNTNKSCDRNEESNCNLELNINTIKTKLKQHNRSNFRTYAKNNKLAYFIGILRTPLPPTNNEWPCDVNNYSIDAACVDCNDTSKKANRASYIIQDTTNWEAILRSDNDAYICSVAAAKKKQNLKTYFLKTTQNGRKVFCREEVRVIFPNANDTPEVEVGRYFTVHSPFRDANKQVLKPYAAKFNEDVEILNSEDSYDKNWGAITVKKIRECRTTGQNQEQFLKNNIASLRFTTVNENEKIQPKVKLTYKGNAKDNASKEEIEEVKKYEDDLNALQLEIERTGVDFGSGSGRSYGVISATKVLDSNYMFKDTQTFTYKLPTGKFKFVAKEGGIFTDEQAVGNDKDTYVNLGIEAIPVSAKNKMMSKEDATLSLSFSLGEDMHLNKSFNANNDYLPTCDTGKGETTNIYKYVKNNAKLGAEKVTGIKDSKKANELAKSACSKMHFCTLSGTSGNQTLTCERSGINTCISDRTTNKMGKCYANNKIKTSGNTNYVCNVNVNPPAFPPIDEVCDPLLDPEKCGCPHCIEPEDPKDAEVEAPIIDKCEFIDGKDSCTIDPGVSKIIYRTIDLNNPFPGKEGENRKTGSNWCQYSKGATDSPYDDTYSCVANNAVVNKYILKNRGVKGEEVYNMRPMYTVELDGEAIEEIRNYNSTTSYENFDLSCETDESNQNGKNCISNFVTQYAKRICKDFTSCSSGGVSR